MPVPRASQALSRFTVLDLTRVRAGPTCVRQLADWGANVVKIDALMEDAGGEQPGAPRRGSDFENFAPQQARDDAQGPKRPRGFPQPSHEPPSEILSFEITTESFHPC